MEEDPTTGAEAQGVYQRLAAPAHSFDDVAVLATLPRLPGAYCIWDGDGTFLYTGIAGRQPGETSPGRTPACPRQRGARVISSASMWPTGVYA